MLQAVQKLNENLVQKHVETPINPLLSKIAQKSHIGTNTYIDSDSDLSSYSGTTSRQIHPLPQQPIPPSPYPSPRDLVPPVDMSTRHYGPTSSSSTGRIYSTDPRNVAARKRREQKKQAKMKQEK